MVTARHVRNSACAYRPDLSPHGEPTNDLDIKTLPALADYAGCAVIISHDRFFLDRIATHILSFEGDAHVEWFEGNFADYLEDKEAAVGGGGAHPAPDEA